MSKMSSVAHILRKTDLLHGEYCNQMEMLVLSVAPEAVAEVYQQDGYGLHRTPAKLLIDKVQGAQKPLFNAELTIKGLAWGASCQTIVSGGRPCCARTILQQQTQMTLKAWKGDLVLSGREHEWMRRPNLRQQHPGHVCM